MRIGFIGLGNVGGKLASNLFNNNFDLTVFDKDNEVLNQFKNKGTKVASSIEQLVSNNDILITCLPSPEACNEVIESSKGIAAYIKENQIWMEMSTTDEDQLKKHALLVESKKAIALEAPVSGGCHRAATGNISIFVGGKRQGFEKALPVLIANIITLLLNITILSLKLVYQQLISFVLHLALKVVSCFLFFLYSVLNILFSSIISVY